MNNKIVTILLLILGVALMLISIFFLSNESAKVLQGTCLGLGAGLLCFSASNMVLQNWYKKHPKEMKQAEVDFNDERNRLIRNRAKAKCADILQWLVMGVAWITILANFPLWVTLLLVGVFLLKTILELYFTMKYEKEM